MERRFFFAQDDDSHWYMVPAYLRPEWLAMKDFDWEDNAACDAFCAMFDGYRIGGGPSHYTFTDPRKEP